MDINLTGPVTRGERAVVVASSIAGIMGLIELERLAGPSFPLGGFFLLPLAVVAAFLPRWPTFALAIATALLREYYGPNVWEPQSIGRVTVSLVAFTGGALFAGELVRNRRITAALLAKTQQEMQTRENAGNEARALVEGSLVGLLHVDSGGILSMAS